MKKSIAVLLIIILCSLIFAACGVDKDTIQSDFSSMIENTATPEQIQATAEFMDENISQVGEDIATQMLTAYEDYLLRYITENPDKTSVEALRTYFDFKNGAIDQDKIEGSEIKAFYDHIKSGSLIVVSYKDSIALKVDYGNLLEKYGDYISESLYRLYELNAETVAKPMAEKRYVKDQLGGTAKKSL
jgi:predicted small secreted protein